MRTGTKKSRSDAASKKKASAAGAKTHVYSGHPAVGLLDCARGVNGNAFTDQSQGEDPAKICGKCGFDEAFHALKPSDYTGATPRPGDWAELLAKVDPEQAAREAGE